MCMWMDISTDKEHDVSVRVVDIGDWLNLVGVLNRSKQKLFVPSKKIFVCAWKILCPRMSVFEHNLGVFSFF